MKSVDLNRINNEIEVFVNDRDWDQFHSIKNLTMALSVECSELVEIFQWMDEDKSNHIKNDAKIKNRVEEEVADIFFYLTRIISKTDINLEEAVLKKMKKNKEKYPVELAKGSSKKYNEL